MNFQTFESGDLFATVQPERETLPPATDLPPFRIGRGFCDRHGRAWIVKIEPVDTQGGLITRTVLIVGGPAPMAAINWTITIARESGATSAMDEHTVARWLADAPIADHPNPAQLLRDALAAQEAARLDRAERAAAVVVARERFADDLAKYAPAWAKAAIIAEQHEDDSDTMTDYHNHRTLRRVVIGWSKHERDLFPELRKAAAGFDETAHLADAPESAEHREKYSMGAGFYLKQGWRDCTGWAVKKRRIDWIKGDVLEFSDAAKGLPGPAAPAPAPRSIEGGGNSAGLFAIEQHTHSKKGFPMWICTMRERVERADYDRFLAAAKALGGWYSRPWGGTPGGFAFKSEAAARDFIGGEPGPDAGGDADAAPVSSRAPAPAVNPAAKLRDLADGMQSAIDSKFADRRSNTPKQQRQAATARQDGAQLERAQKILRALADCHDAGTVPACLARVTTKAAALELATEEIDRSNSGYYCAGFATGRPYDWARIGKPDAAERAAAAWALLDGSGDASRREADALRRKIDALKFAKIPGYFPTPADLVARMIDAADLPDGARVLEPSAGSGAIADALRDAGHAVDCIERHASLRAILADKGYKLIGGDFTDMSPPAYPAPLYDAVIMNPPFEHGQDCDHVARAWSFVKPGGALVAIMGAGVTFRQNSPYSTFRAWAESEGGEFVDIPAGAFKESGTGVASVMLTLRKGG
jgi:predicted RNA methylase